jgi:DNA invertase Pin-like site-specific DNA recombinase
MTETTDDWKGESFIRNVKRDGFSQQARHQMQGKGGRNMPPINFTRKSDNRRKKGETAELVRQFFDKGLSAQAIADKLGTTRDTVHWHCRRLGLKFRDRDEARGKPRRSA